MTVVNQTASDKCAMAAYTDAFDAMLLAISEERLHDSKTCHMFSRTLRAHRILPEVCDVSKLEKTYGWVNLSRMLRNEHNLEIRNICIRYYGPCAGTTPRPKYIMFDLQPCSIGCHLTCCVQ